MTVPLHDEQPLAPGADRVLIGRLLTYARPHAAPLLACVGLLALLSGVQLAQPYVVKLVIDRVLDPGAHPSWEVLAPYVAAYGALLLFTFALAWGQGLLLQRTGQRILARVRQDVFDHLLTMSVSFFDRHPVGRLVTRVASDPETLNDMYTTILVNLFRDAFMIVGLVGMLFWLDWRLALVVAAATPLVAGTVGYFRRRARDLSREARTRLAALNAYMAEQWAGVRTIQAFNREAIQAERFAHRNRHYNDVGLRHVRLFAVFRPSLDFFATCCLAAVLLLAGHFRLQGTLELGTLFAFTTYVRQAFQPISELAEKFATLQTALASAERIFQLLDTPAEQPEALAPVRDPVLGSLEFDRVWFAYQNQHWVLRELSFQVKPGTTVALVGPTGAGKSSILSLVARFYDPQQGRVLLDGIDLRAWEERTRRTALGIVLQDGFLFSTDVARNIGLDHPEIDRARIERAAREVGADAFIGNLPGSYDAPITHAGATLSAGQRQLIALARALAFDPAILVLDEATSNLDSQTEALFQQALQRAGARRTTLIVAHRLATIQHADHILVLHQGQLAEQGSHAELLARGGLYHTLWRLQHELADASS